MKNKFLRLTSFINPDKWNQSRNDPANNWRNVKMPNGRNYPLTIFFKYGAYGIYFEAEKTWQRFDTAEEAKHVAFELVERAKARTT